MPAILDHVTISASDFATSLAFYDAALAPLGLTRVVELVDEEEQDADVEAAAWGRDGERAALWLIAGSPAGGAHLSLRADSRAEVEAFHAAAVHAGGVSHSQPRRWPIYRRGEFNAIVRDPDGNLIEAVSAE